MAEASLALLRGTLDLLILRSLEPGPRHGYAVAEWLEGATDGTLLLEEGTLYPALHRLEEEGLVESFWQASPSGPRRRYYHLTAAGETGLAERRADWIRLMEAVNGALGI